MQFMSLSRHVECAEISRFLSSFFVCNFFNYSYLFVAGAVRMCSRDFFVFWQARVVSSIYFPLVQSENLILLETKSLFNGDFSQLHFRYSFIVVLCLPCAGYSSHEVYMKSFCNLHKNFLPEPSLNMSFMNKKKRVVFHLVLGQLQT